MEGGLDAGAFMADQLAHLRELVSTSPEDALALLDDLAARFPRNHWLRARAALLAADMGRPAEAWRRFERITQSDAMVPALLDHARARLARMLQAEGPPPLRINTPADYTRTIPGRRFLPGLPALSIDRKFPSGFPFEMAFPPLVGNRNDFRFIVDAAHRQGFGAERPGLMLHVVATLGDAGELPGLIAALAAQTWPAAQMRVTLHAPGKLDLPEAPFALEQAKGAGPWQISRKRQIAAMGQGDGAVLFLTGGTRPGPLALETAARYLAVSDAIQVPLALPEGKDAKARQGGVLAERALQDHWMRQRFPYRRIPGLNFAIHARRFAALGGFDPRFGGADLAVMEFSYRFWNMGGYVLPVHAGGEVVPSPAGPDREADGTLLTQLCPGPWDRKEDGRFEIPKVSIYIPAYKAARYITDAVNSVLDQDFEDLEICIANDGSPDNTMEVLETHYADNPRVRWVSNRNGGIGCGSNSAIRLARGMYIGQLDSDDRLKPGAVRRLAGYLDDNPAIGCVYSSCERINADGSYAHDEYSFPVFSREKMALVSIAHHFRMFRRQAWERTETFREDIVNAVDYDMFLKLSEVTEFHHIEEMFYQRRWHGENTSNVNEGHQTKNTYVVQTKMLERMGMDRFWEVHVPDPEQPRKVTYRRKEPAQRVFFWPDYGRANPYQRLLYDGARDRVDFIAADIDAALKATRDAQDRQNITFHLHWLNKLYRGLKTEAEAVQVTAEFIDKLKKLRYLGGRVIWTIHNTLSHDTPWKDQELALSRALVEIADVLHVHSAESVPEIEAHFPLDAAKIRISRHGHYIGTYPDFLDRDTARAQLGLDPEDEVILFLGQIRPYKGVDELVAAFRSILRDRPRAVLLLAGQAEGDVLAGAEGLTEAERARIRLHTRFIDDMELQLFFRAADVGAYPYRNILTSGSILLALSYGVPVVTPMVGMTREVLDGTGGGVLYDGAEGAAGLEAALRELLALRDAQGAGTLSAAARAAAAAQPWPDFGQTVMAV